MKLNVTKMHTITVRLSDIEIGAIDTLARRNGNHSRTAEATALLRAGLAAQEHEDRLLATVKTTIRAALGQPDSAAEG